MVILMATTSGSTGFADETPPPAQTIGKVGAAKYLYGAHIVWNCLLNAWAHRRYGFNFDRGAPPYRARPSGAPGLPGPAPDKADLPSLKWLGGTGYAGAGVGHFQARAVARIRGGAIRLNGGAQVFQVFLIHNQVAVAGEAELVAAFHFHTGEKAVNVTRAKSMIKTQSRCRHRSFPAAVEHARQNARCLHNRHARSAAECIFTSTAKLSDFIQRARKRVEVKPRWA